MRQLESIDAAVAATAFAVLSFVSPVSARAATHVVNPGQSIQAAVDAASPGDTIVVRAGEYYESVTIRKDGLTLRAQGNVTLEPPYYGSSECYLAGLDVGICVMPVDFESGSYTNRVRDVTITGFRIAGFAGNGVFGVGTSWPS